MSIDVNALTQSGFTLAPSERTFRMVAAVRGQDGGGKTHLALTAPGPICHIAFDIGGLEGMREKFVAGEVTGQPVTIYEIRIKKPVGANKRDNKGKQDVKEQAGEQWERLKTALAAALASGVRTIVIDQETDLWELARLKEFGSDSNVAHLYAQLNQEYKNLLFQVYDHPAVNLILIQKLKKQYESRKVKVREGVEEKEVWNGRWEPAGFGDLRYIVQVTVDCWRDDGADADGNESREFHMKVNKCRQNAVCTGVELVGEEISWVNLGQMVFPESGEGDWK